jgi:hypothetical protein
MITIKDQIIRPVLPHWEEFNGIIENTNDVLRIAHTTVRNRLAFANMHLSILRQASDNTLKRAFFEDIIINLVPSFEVIAHVLNQFYGIRINDIHVILDHKNKDDKKNKRSKNCLRCKLRKHNIHIATFLDNELKTDSPVDDWYAALIQFRHQIVHRPHYIAKSGSHNYLVPDDPSIFQPSGRSYYDVKKKRTVWANYTKERDITKYIEISYNTVSFVLILENEEIRKVP